jgi:signal transduction histidine kinase
MHQPLEPRFEQQRLELIAKSEELATELALRKRAEEALANREAMMGRMRVQQDESARAIERLSSERDQIVNALREARAAADSSCAKSEFLSSLSHELRTALNAILGFAQLLQRDKKEQLSDHHQHRVAQILNGGAQLLRLIDDVLDLSRIEAGELQVTSEPVLVAKVLEEVRMTLEPMAARQGIRIELELLVVEAKVAADRMRYAQILMNLGSNAIKYNRPPGKVTFSVLTPRPGHVRVVVRDTGLGIPTDQQDTLFQPFQRAGRETGPIEGTGMGLVIARRLAQSMRGDVRFRSIWGEGSEFWIDMPVHESQAPSSDALLARQE